MYAITTEFRNLVSSLSLGIRTWVVDITKRVKFFINLHKNMYDFFFWYFYV